MALLGNSIKRKLFTVDDMVIRIRSTVRGAKFLTQEKKKGLLRLLIDIECNNDKLSFLNISIVLKLLVIASVVTILLLVVYFIYQTEQFEAISIKLLVFFAYGTVLLIGVFIILFFLLAIFSLRTNLGDFPIYKKSWNAALVMNEKSLVLPSRTTGKQIVLTKVFDKMKFTTKLVDTYGNIVSFEGWHLRVYQNLQSRTVTYQSKDDDKVRIDYKIVKESYVNGGQQQDELYVNLFIDKIQVISYSCTLSKNSEYKSDGRLDYYPYNFTKGLPNANGHIVLVSEISGVKLILNRYFYPVSLL